jgi:hypothetical protein
LRTERWRVFAQDKEKTKEACKALLAHFQQAPQFLGKGPWTADEVHQLWALLFRRRWGVRKDSFEELEIQVVLLVELIEDDCTSWVDPVELRLVLTRLHGESVPKSAFRERAKKLIDMIRNALVGHGGRPRGRRLKPWDDAAIVEQERVLFWVLDADRETLRRKRRAEITLRDVLKERLDAGDHIFGEVRVRSITDLLASDPSLPRQDRVQTFVSAARKASSLEFEYRRFLSEHKIRGNPTRAKIHAALGLRKRRNKKRTRIPITP